MAGACLEAEIPAQEACCIEYPGYVVNPENAIQTLGGEDAITLAHANNTDFMQLKFRPGMTLLLLDLVSKNRSMLKFLSLLLIGDPLSHSIYGDKRGSQGLLLLKITRKKVFYPH